MIGERGGLQIFHSRETFELERFDDEDESSPVLGLCVGLAAGFLATFAMDGFQSFIGQITAPLGKGDGDGSGGADQEEEPSTVKLGRRIGRKVFERELDEDSARAVSEALHYGYGTVMGGVYGLLAELFPRTTTAAGAPYGTMLFLLGDEVMVPALGLAKAPTQYSISTHARALGAHLIYGTTLDLLRRGIRACIESTSRSRRARAADRDRDLLWIDRGESAG